MWSIDFPVPMVCFAYEVPFYSDTAVVQSRRCTDSYICRGVVNGYIQFTDCSFHCFLVPGFSRLTIGRVFEYAYWETHSSLHIKLKKNQFLPYFLPIGCI